MGAISTTGDAIITLSGKTIIGRCDPIEKVNQSYDANNIANGFYHTSMPLSTGAFGVRLDPYNAGISQRPVRQADGSITVYNLVNDIYNSLVSGTGPGGLTRTVNGVQKTAWYWSKDGAVWPNVGYISTYANGQQGTQDLDCTNLGGYTREGDSSANTNYLHTAGGISPNDWGRQDQLPCTIRSNSSLYSANPGYPCYWLTTTDLYPAPVYEQFYKDGYLTKQVYVYYDRVCVGGVVSSGGAESYIVDAQKTLDCNAVVQIQQTNKTTYPLGYSRVKNSIFAWDGHITATSTKILATGVANPAVSDPISSADAQYRVGSRTLYRNLNDTSTNNRPPVPPPLNTAAFGDANFSLDVKIGLNFAWQAGQNQNFEYPTGATVELGVDLPDGTYYPMCSGTPITTTDQFGQSTCVLDAQSTDYWFGQPFVQLTNGTGAIKLRAKVTFQDQTYPDGKHCPAFSADSDVAQTGVSFYIGSATSIAQPPITIGNWTCNQPPITFYQVSVAGSPPAPATSVSGAYASTDSLGNPELVVQNAPTTGQSNILHTKTVNNTTFTSYTVPALTGITSSDGATSPSLLINPATNQHRIFYMANSKFYKIDANKNPTSSADWGTPTLLSLSGYTLPYVVADPLSGWNKMLMATVKTGDSVTVDILQSLDQGTTWSVFGASAGTVAKSISRPSLAISTDNTVYLACTLANSIAVRRSLDGGKTFSAPVNAITVGNTNGCRGATIECYQGFLYVSSLVSATASNTAQPIQIVRSGDGGATWSAPVTSPVTAQSGAFSINKNSGRMYLLETYYSDDQGKTFTHN